MQDSWKIEKKKTYNCGSIKNENIYIHNHCILTETKGHIGVIRKMYGEKIVKEFFL